MRRSTRRFGTLPESNHTLADLSTHPATSWPRVNGSVIPAYCSLVRAIRPMSVRHEPQPTTLDENLPGAGRGFKDVDELRSLLCFKKSIREHMPSLSTSILLLIGMRR